MYDKGVTVGSGEGPSDMAVAKPQKLRRSTRIATLASEETLSVYLDCNGHKRSNLLIFLRIHRRCLLASDRTRVHGGEE